MSVAHQVSHDKTERWGQQLRMVASLCNQSFFSFNNFRKPCNDPNLYRSGYSRTSRLKTLPRSHDGTGMSIVSGLRLMRPESMPSTEITYYKPTRQEAFSTTPFPANIGGADHSYSRV